MKTPRQLLLVLGALCGAAGLFAQGANASASPKHNDHETLSYSPAEITRHFLNGTDKVSVTWTWKGDVTVGGKTMDVYDCVIKQDKDPQSDWGYSLYNLEIQGRLWKVHVVAADAPNLVFTSGTAPSATITTGTNANGTLNAVIPAACAGNPPVPAAHKPPAADRIGFIKFTGPKCVMEVRAERVRHGPRTKSSHDATPPPPDGGGEN